MTPNVARKIKSEALKVSDAIKDCDVLDVTFKSSQQDPNNRFIYIL